MKKQMLKTFRNIGVLYRLMYEEMNDKLSCENLSYIEATILYHINEDINKQTELCKHLVVDKAQISRTLRKLEEKKYVTRLSSTDDKREKNLSLTTLGEEKLNYYNKVFSAWYNELFFDFNKDELKLLMKKVDVLYNRVKK